MNNRCHPLRTYQILKPQHRWWLGGGYLHVLWTPREAACSFNSYYYSYYSDRFHGSTLSHGSKVFKFGTHLSRLWSRHSLKYDLDWPNGGAIGTFLIHELWRGIFRALYDLQIWNSAHMCLYSQGTDLPQKPLPSAILFFRNFELSVKHSNNMSSKNHWPIVLKLGRHNLGADPQQFIRADFWKITKWPL